jgi:hypothetical protein
MKKRVLVYHRRSVQEREDVAARRRANKKVQEAETVKGMQQLGERVVCSSESLSRRASKGRGTVSLKQQDYSKS